MDLDLEWDTDLQHRQGAEERLCGIDVFHDFEWLDFFSDERTQFRNGKNLANFVMDNCPADKTPALLLTTRSDVQEGIRQTERFMVFVVNILEFRDIELSAALTYLASHLGVDITDVQQLQDLTASADPQLIRAFIEASLDIDHIVEWVSDNQQGLEQLRGLVNEESGDVGDLARDLRAAATMEELPADDLAELIEFLRSAKATNLGQLVGDADVLFRLYESAPEAFREAIRSDADAYDVVALTHRKAVVDEFRLLLEDDAAFDERAQMLDGPEAVWQRFLESNPWILGIGLAGQLLTSWNDARLEQVVAGFSVAGPRKRVDALLRTAGRIRSLVFAEIKHHRTELLGARYRKGSWPPSAELSGGITQLQQTVHLAVSQISERLPDVDEDSAETGESSWLIRPRSFLIVGHLDQLRGASGVIPDKHRSFELFRRNLYEPEVLTFDELLARAEWGVELAEMEHD